VLSIFRTNQLLAGILILGYALFLHLPDFWQSAPPVQPMAGLGNVWVTPWLDGAPLLSLGVVIALLFLQAVFANAIIFAHRITSPANLFPGVFVVLLGSLLPDFHQYSGYLLANVFLLLSLRSYLKAFRINNSADHIFNTGFWMGIAALFVPTYLIFLLAYSAMLPILKSGKFRDQLILFIGAIMPLYLVGMGYYWYDMLPVFWEQQWASAFSLPQTIAWDKIPMVTNIAMITLIIIILTSRRHYLAKTKMDVQIKIDILFWLLLGAGLSIWWIMPWNMQQWQALVPIAGILLSFNFTKAKPQTAEAWHLVLLILLFYLNFAPVLKLPLW
jgi:hypothetical protein